VDNELTSFPIEITSLRNLITLNFAKNKIAELPGNISSLRNLSILNLSHNELALLPLELGELMKLHRLNISDNTKLQELPLNLRQLPSLQTINYANTGIREELVLSILRCSRGEREYPLLINTWLAAADLKKEMMANFDDFKATDKEILCNWLIRLMHIKDYMKQQKKVARLVCDLLVKMLQHPDFMRVAISQMKADDDCCSDRTSMSLNIIYTFSRLYELSDSASFEEKLDLLIRGAKTHALRRLLSEKITNYEKKKSIEEASPFFEKESVEIFLYYETALKEKLNLLTAVEDMAYARFGKREWIDLDKLQEEIEENFIEDLMNIPVFQSLIQEEESIKNKLSEIEQKYQIKLESLNTRQPVGNEFSDDFLHWKHMNYMIGQNFEREKKSALLEEIKMIQGTQITGSKRRGN